MGYAGASHDSLSPQVNQMIIQHIQAMITANPSYLTSGIPNDLITKIISSGTMQRQSDVLQHTVILFSYILSI